jgi:hypothetical protein
MNDLYAAAKVDLEVAAKANGDNMALMRVLFEASRRAKADFIVLVANEGY